jgi:hypothetical protein
MNVRVHFAHVVEIAMFNTHLFGTLQIAIQQDMLYKSVLKEIELPKAECLQRAIIANPIDPVQIAVERGMRLTDF